MNKSVESAKIIIEKNYKFISKLEDISDNLNCNYHTLRSEFVKCTGKTLCIYLNTIRCNKAKKYLKNTNWKLYKIATEVGFADEKYFIKVFMKIFGKRPLEYRN